MAYNQELTIPAHHNIYNGDNNRLLNITYSIPQKGTNENTGLLLLVPGFGGDINSNVYKKMRESFADTYNLVTIQCDYFGSKFMQASDEVIYSQDSLKSVLSEEDTLLLARNPNAFSEVIKNYSVQVNCKASLNESINEFADMGYMQAIDNITALEAIKLILNENNLIYNDARIIGYGHSHGAYLLHLINKIAPHLFTYIIDNSAWLEPVYLTHNRYLFKNVGLSTFQIEFEYLAKLYLKDKKALSLNNFYKAFDNHAYIYSLLGTTDDLVDVKDKKISICNLKNTKFELVDEKKVDGTIFKSTNHGLDADFLQLFESSVKKLPEHKNQHKYVENYTVAFGQTLIKVDYSMALPLFLVLLIK